MRIIYKKALKETVVAQESLPQVPVELASLAGCAGEAETQPDTSLMHTGQSATCSQAWDLHCGVQ